MPASNSPLWHVALARRGLALGEPLFAYEVCAEGVERWKTHGGLRQVLALALARSGATESAHVAAEAVYKSGHRDAETLGLLGRIHKDLWQQHNDAQALEQAIRYYQMGFRREPKNYFPGINAATLTLCAGRTRAAHRLANAVLDICFKQLQATPATANQLAPLRRPAQAAHTPAGGKACKDYWLLATIGEAALLLDNMALAHAAYRAARQSPDAGFGSLATTRRNAALILGMRADGAATLEPLFPKPHIAIFSGHMVDASRRAKPRFPRQAVPRAAAAITQWVGANAIAIGYASAASGGDLLFLDALKTHRAERHVILPNDHDTFTQYSVRPAGKAWVARYQKHIATATSVIVAGDEITDGEAYRFSNRMTIGLARARARRVDGEVRGLALWDGTSGKAGGTGSAIANWRAAGVPVTVIDPLTGTARPLKGARTNFDDAPTPKYGQRETVALLFADVTGFSKLTETQLPLFIRHFLGPVGRLAASGTGRPLTSNTWGDGIYMTFKSASDAGCFALKLCEVGSRSDWAALGLPDNMNIRIGLHAGPAIRTMDPVIKQLNFMGSNVSRAARIEPVTPPGQVYCSEPFAALAEAEAVRAFVCDYVGMTALAKKYGSFPTYRVRAVPSVRGR